MPRNRKISLGDLLTDEEIAHLHTVWEQSGGDMMAFMDTLKPWFHEPERAERLESRGMIPSYAAYAIPYFYAQAKEAQAKQETDDIVNRITGSGGNPSLN